MKNWKDLKFQDTSGAEFQITQKEGNVYTVKILKFPVREVMMTMASPKFKFPNNEFAMSQHNFNQLLKNKEIKILD